MVCKAPYVSYSTDSTKEQPCPGDNQVRFTLRLHTAIQMIIYVGDQGFHKSKYKKVGVLLIWKAKSNVSSVGPSSERNTTFILTIVGFPHLYLPIFSIILPLF